MLYTISVYQLFWGLLSQIFGFVDICLALSLIAFAITNLSIACQKCTGKTLFEVVCLTITTIKGGRRGAGRVSVACQTTQTFGGYRSVATQTNPCDDDFHYNKRFPRRLRNNGVPCPFPRVPDEGVSVFADRRNAYRLRGRFALVQDAQPSGTNTAGVTPGTPFSGLGKRDMDSFEDQSTHEESESELELVARPDRKILAPRVRGAGTAQCPIAPQSAALAGVLLDDNEDGTTIDIDDEENDDLEIIIDKIVSPSAPHVEEQSPRVEAESPRVEAQSPRVEADMGEKGEEDGKEDGGDVGPGEALVLEVEEEEGDSMAPAGFGEDDDDDDMEFAPAGFGEEE
ncbi:hypothetical protein H2204_006372 [Knufia peltigerae]|uniref:Uncharacterized protein n=1 Tax=Knufia peltigerae TaxID=1002370 RepID=A0AA38Y3R1_9EURO|nr:hypothetical protein H2204_006372 [Knufia peltigerae]